MNNKADTFVWSNEKSEAPFHIQLFIEKTMQLSTFPNIDCKNQSSMNVLKL